MSHRVTRIFCRAQAAAARHGLAIFTQSNTHFKRVCSAGLELGIRARKKKGAVSLRGNSAFDELAS